MREEITNIINESLKLDKCETCKSLKNKDTSLQEILGNFIKGESIA